MQFHDIERSIFILTGMHRSGTSLTASLLQSAGIDFGQRLMPPNQGNVKGYFENLDFVEFHQMVLRSQGVADTGWTLDKHIPVEDYYVKCARQVVAQNSSKPIWGWKDPRTTLFLEFWADLLPEANFLLVYRPPWEVIDSIYRRAGQDDSIFFNAPDLAAKVWINYNQKLLDFYDQHPNRCLLVSLYSIIAEANTFISKINETFQVNLEPPATDLYDQSLLHTQSSDFHRASLVCHYFPEALEIYRQLDARKAGFNCESPEPDFENIKASPYAVWAFRDWASTRKLEKQSKTLHSQWEQTKEQLHHTQSQLEQSQAQLLYVQSAFEESQSQLRHVQSAFEQSQAQLHHVQSAFEESQSQLHHVQSAFEESQSQLHHVQSAFEQSQAQLHHVQSAFEESQSQLHHVQSAFEQSQGQLQHVQSAFEYSQGQLQHVQSAFEESQAQLEITQQQRLNAEATLASSQTQLQQNQLDLEQLQIQLAKTQAELQESQMLIDAMQTSKFWQLRTQWVKLKKVLGLANNKV